jgi:hypothetical protein
MATDTKTEAATGIPPYIPFDTLVTFIERLKQTTVPTAIDKSMMDKVAGGVQTYLLAAMRFLGLTEGKLNEVTPSLDKLVESHGTAGYKGTLAEIIKEAYAPVVQNLDLAKATQKQLDEKFSAHKLDGVLRERAIRFYLKGLTAAGIPYSPHLGKRKARGSATNGAAKTRRTKQEKPSPAGNASDTQESTQDDLPKDLIEFPIPIGDSQACIRVPRSITSKQMPLIQAIVGAVDALAKQNDSGK